MFKLYKAPLILSLSVLSCLSEVRASLNEEVAALVQFETRGNAAAVRPGTRQLIENYEIPLKVLEADVADRIPKEVRDALIFEKNGEKYVRWIINPEDTKWYKEVEKWLTKKKLSTKRYQYFLAYMTASRSYIIQDPATQTEFSAKVSTNVTGGNWRDKKQAFEDGTQIRRAADFVWEQKQSVGFVDSVIMDEPAVFGVKDLDQAMVIRTLDGLVENDRVYLPGFSAVHERVGRVIAEKNGAKDVAKFWNEHYNLPLARALAEFAAKTGITYDSPHSQNFLVELDNEFRPTGRIVLRDFGDAYVHTEFFDAFDKSGIVKIWEQGNVVSGELKVAVGITHGNTNPSWLPDPVYARWGQDFFKEFERRFSELTGVKTAELRANQLMVSGRYYFKTYGVDSPGWKRFFSKIKTKACSHRMSPLVGESAQP